MMRSETEDGLSLDDVLAAPHAMTVYEAELDLTGTACGNLVGARLADELAVGLGEINRFGPVGIAVFEADDGRLDVTMYVGHARSPVSAGGATADDRTDDASDHDDRRSDGHDVATTAEAGGQVHDRAPDRPNAPARRGRERMRRMSAIAGAALTGLLFPAAALAHVTIDVADGRYAVELGFEREPAYLGQPNAVFVKVSENGSGGATPVDGLAATLNATVEKDGATRDLPLAPQGEGVYLAPFFPTVVGDYTFRLEGEIGGAPVAIEESSSPSTFHAVEPLPAVQFPAPLPDANAAAAAAGDAAGDAAAAAASARTFAVIAIALATLGVGLAAIGLARRAA